MGNFLLERLKKHRTNLISALNEPEQEPDNTIAKFVSVVANGVLYLWYCMIDYIVFRLEGVLICAMYCSEYDNESEYMSFVKSIIDNKEKLETLFCEEGSNYEIIIFYSRKLRRISSLFKHNQKQYELYEKVINGYVSTCIHCGCGILGPFPYSYRDNGGCIGKTSECYICREYNHKGVSLIREYCKEYGSEKAIIKAANDGFDDEEETC